jgi:hypothetical protein
MTEVPAVGTRSCNEVVRLEVCLATVVLVVDLDDERAMVRVQNMPRARQDRWRQVGDVVLTAQLFVGTSRCRMRACRHQFDVAGL